MAVIQKTIKVPENHQIVVDLPKDIPVGDTADIVVTITVAAAKKQPPRKSLLELAGALADSKTFAGDSVELIRKVRDEW